MRLSPVSMKLTRLTATSSARRIIPAEFLCAHAVPIARTPGPSGRVAVRSLAQAISWLAAARLRGFSGNRSCRQRAC
jgi:hypothetical protein